MSRRAVATMIDATCYTRSPEAGSQGVRLETQLLDVLEQAVIATDLTGIITYWNRHAEQLYGWSAAECIGRNIIALSPTPSGAAESADVIHRLARGESRSGEFTVHRKDGTPFRAFITNSSIVDDTGRLTGLVSVSFDFTARRETENALKASEAFFRAAFQSSAIASVLTSPDGRILRANPAFATLMQYREDELCGRHITELTHRGDAIRVQNVRERILARETESEEHEKRFVRRDGTIVDGLSSVALVRGADGEPLYFTTQVVDISDRKRAEAARLQREEYLSQVLAVQEEIGTAAMDEATVIRLIADRARSLTRADGAIVEIVEGDQLAHRSDSGTPTEFTGDRQPLKGSLAGLCVKQRVLLRSADMWNDPRVNQERARRNGARSGIAVPLMYDGRVVGVLKVHSKNIGHFVEGDENTLRLLAGITAAALSHAADFAAKKALVAERTAALDSLRERESHFRALIENSADPIIIIDESLTITYASPAVEALFGLSPEQIVGLSMVDFAHPEDAQRLTESFTCDMKELTDPSVTELRMKHTDGAWRVVRSRGRNLLSDPALCAIVVNLTDVTNETLLAQQLRQSQKLEAVGQLAGGIAHDFNNLLTVIQVHGEFLSADLDSRDPRHDDVQEIRHAATRAAGLTHQLLAFSRQQLLQPKVLDVNAVVSSLAPMLRRLIGEDTDITTIPGEGDLRVLADLGQVEQVLMNLVINARDAMPDGGSIIIESRIVDLDTGYAGLHDVVVAGRYVMLSVSDTGTGMDKQTRERIFEPFFTTKEPGRGTGLGLSTVYGIVKQSNGYIWVYSEEGMGTIFKIYLPLAESALSPQSATLVAPMPSGCETVLLVEDEAAVRLLARRILVRQGYRVLEASNGSEGLATAAAHEGAIDIVVTDVVMPQMNGRGLVERLTAERPHIRVLYLSGYTNDDIVRRGALDHGGRRILQKPFTTSALALAVRSALDTPEVVVA